MFYDIYLRYLFIGMVIYFRGIFLLGIWWNDFKIDLILYLKLFVKLMINV